MLDEDICKREVACCPAPPRIWNASNMQVTCDTWHQIKPVSDQQQEPMKCTWKYSHQVTKLTSFPNSKGGISVTHPPPLARVFLLTKPLTPPPPLAPSLPHQTSLSQIMNMLLNLIFLKLCFYHTFLLYIFWIFWTWILNIKFSCQLCVVKVTKPDTFKGWMTGYQDTSLMLSNQIVFKYRKL